MVDFVGPLMPQTHLQFLDRKSGLILRVPVGEAKGQ